MPVPETAFGRQKARALLGILLAARGAVHRERIQDWLWPRRRRSGRRPACAWLSTACGGALAPELEANAPGSPIVTEGESVRLALGDQDEWDVATFLDLVRGPGRRTATRSTGLERAEALYAGPFLPEWPYDDWAAPARRELEERHVEVLERLAAALVGLGRVPEAVRRYRRLAALEPEREAWHRALMDCYASDRRARPGVAPVPRLPHGAAARAGHRPGPRDAGALRADPAGRGARTGRNGSATAVRDGRRDVIRDLEDTVSSAFPYTIPAAAPLYPPPPYRYRDCPLMVIPFTAGPGVTRRLVPEPLEPNPDDVAYVAIGHLHNDRLGSTHEAFIVVPSSDGTREGNYAVFLYLENDACVTSGREIWGWPKKLAEIDLVESPSAWPPPSGAAGPT